MLSDVSIMRQIEKGNLSITRPGGMALREWQFQPVSVDLLLGRVALRNGTPLPFGVADEVLTIKPLQFLLGSTLERVRLCENLVGTVVGKSTIAREGLIVEAAGLVDPGFHGQLTLELFNMSNKPIALHRHQPICQLALDWTDTTPGRIYGEADNHYQGQSGPTPSWRLML